jgi:hypothetical protein
VPLSTWLAIRAILTGALLVCAAILWFGRSGIKVQIISMLIFRAGLFNLPVWLFLTGLLVVRLERARRRRNPMIDAPPAPEQTIDPLA